MFNLYVHFNVIRYYNTGDTNAISYTYIRASILYALENSVRLLSTCSMSIEKFTFHACKMYYFYLIRGWYMPRILSIFQINWLESKQSHQMKLVCVL